MTTKKPFCPICSSTNSKPYFNRGEISLEKCVECEVVWWTTPPSRADTKTFFQNEYITNETRLTEKFIEYRSQAIRRIASYVHKELPKSNIKLLDIGTASGSFLNAMMELGVENVAGVEPSTYAAQSVRERLNVDVFTGFIEDQKIGDSTYDVVTCLDTLCLVSEPHVDVAEMSRVLKSGGDCYIELPGFTYRMLKGKGILGSLLYGSKTGIQLGVHTLYFNKRSLKELFAKHNLSLVNAIPIGGPIYGSRVKQQLQKSFFSTLSLIYKILPGNVEIAPKVLYHFKKIG